MTDGLRIAHLRIAPQWAILRWAILTFTDDQIHQFWEKIPTAIEPPLRPHFRKLCCDFFRKCMTKITVYNSANMQPFFGTLRYPHVCSKLFIEKGKKQTCFTGVEILLFKEIWLKIGLSKKKDLNPESASGHNKSNPHLHHLLTFTHLPASGIHSSQHEEVLCV